jgi:hypothetical protein
VEEFFLKKEKYYTFALRQQYYAASVMHFPIICLFIVSDKNLC